MAAVWAWFKALFAPNSSSTAKRPQQQHKHRQTFDGAQDRQTLQGGASDACLPTAGPLRSPSAYSASAAGTAAGQGTSTASALTTAGTRLLPLSSATASTHTLSSTSAANSDAPPGTPAALNSHKHSADSASHTNGLTSAGCSSENVSVSFAGFAQPLDSSDSHRSSAQRQGSAGHLAGQENGPSFADGEGADVGLVTPPPLSRFIVRPEDGLTMGIANTVRRFAPDKPVKIHGTPFEARVDKAVLLEKALQEQQ